MTVTKSPVLDHEIFQSHPYQTIVSLAKKERKDLYLVGGFLRDLKLDRFKDDLDLDFILPKGAIEFGKRVSRLLKAGFVILDKEHGCSRVVYKDKANNRILTFDFVDFRGKDLKEDLLKRDFTVNTLALPLSTDCLEILDHFNACKDMSKKVLRIVADPSFDDDPLRILRAFSMSALFELKIAPQTMRLIDRKRESLRDVSGERLRDELFKILSVKESWRFINLLDKHSVLEEVIPQVTVMHNVKQGGYHHLDVWGHSLETVKKLDEVLISLENDKEISVYLDESMASNRSRRQLIKLAALLHDIGKPKAHEVRAGKTMFHGHERIGRIISDSVSARLKLSTKEKFALDTIIFWHLRPGYLADNAVLTKRAIHRYFRDTGDEAVSTLLISIADQRATRGPLATPASRLKHEKVSWRLIHRYFEMKKEKPFVRLINGKDLIKRLKLVPGPVFSKILNKIEEAQVGGRIKTKKEALEFANRIAKNENKRH